MCCLLGGILFMLLLTALMEDFYVSLKVVITLVYDTIQYDSVYLTCNKMLTGSQLSLPHG